MPPGRAVLPAIRAATAFDEPLGVADIHREKRYYGWRRSGRLNACYATWTARQSLPINATVF